MDASSILCPGEEERAEQDDSCSATRQELRDTEEIWRRAVSFYSQLYCSEYTAINEMFDSFCGELPRVPEDVNVGLEDPLEISPGLIKVLYQDIESVLKITEVLLLECTEG